METNSIAQIRKLRDEIRQKIKDADKSLFPDQKFGSETEYTYKGILGGLEALLTDISSLTKAPARFVKLSTYNERSAIQTHLQNIVNHFHSPAHVVGYLDGLKTLIRSFNVRNTTDRQIEFEAAIDSTLKLKTQIEEELKAIKKIRAKIEESHSNINSTHESSNEKLDTLNKELEEISESKSNLHEEINELQELNESLSQIQTTAGEQLESIKSSATESKSNEKLIDAFAQKVQEREQKLGELEQLTDANTERLNEYDEEREKVLKEAKELIESAKKALEYKTAEGISASFQDQHDNSKNYWIIGGWIAGAIICLGVASWLGIRILEESTANISIIIGRIALLPLPIAAAIFCSRQYVKQKNLIEDYAYKMVLAKSIVGFSEQLKKNSSGDNEEYIHYIKTALEEIHKDPLRKREPNKESKNESGSANVKDMLDVFERAVKLSGANKDT